MGPFLIEYLASAPGAADMNLFAPSGFMLMLLLVPFIVGSGGVRFWFGGKRPREPGPGAVGISLLAPIFFNTKKYIISLIFPSNISNSICLWI